MDDGAPGLAVEFQLDFGGALAGLGRMDDVIGSTAANAVREFNRIENAVRNGLNLTDAAAQLKLLNTTIERETAGAARALNRVEQAGEGVSRSMERQIATFGMTRAAAAAYRAEQAGLVELAERLRAQEAQLVGMREAAARATLAEAAAVKRAADEHQRLVAAVRGSQAAQAADAAAAERLRMSTDPLYAATKRLNGEIAESTRLYHLGATAPAEYARQQQVLRGRLNEVTAAHDATAISARRGASSMTQLSFQINDVATMAAMGAKPMQIFASQAGQIFQIAQMAEGGVKGFSREIGALLLRFAPVLAVVGVATSAFALFERAVSSGINTKKMVAELGLTRDEIKKLKDVSIDAGDVITATFEVAFERLGLSLATGKKDIASGWSTAMDWMTDKTRSTLAGIYGVFVGTFRALSEIVKKGLKGEFSTDLVQTLAGIGKSVAIETKKADAALKRFGADVTSRAASNKLRDLRRQRDELIADRTPKKPKVDHHAEQLAREAAAIEAQIRNLYKLADAYGVSGAAALIAESRVKAETDAIKKRGDIEAAVDRQVRLVIAQRVSDRAKAAAVMRDQARLQTEVNGEIAAGNLPAERAGELLQERIAELPLLQAIEAAQQRGLTEEAKRATKALEEQRSAQADARAAEMGARFVAADQAADQRLADLQAELKLIGATDEARVRALTTIRATREAQVMFPDALPNQAEYNRKQVEIAVGTQALADAQRRYNEELTFTADRWDVIAGKVQSAASGMADAFGSVGRAIGDVASIFATFQADRERAEVQHRERLKAAGKDERAIARENQLFALRSSGAQVAAYGDMASAAKGFFKEGSAGYKALGAAEKVFRAVQLAMSVQAMIQNTAETLGFVTNSAAKAVAAGTEGIATQSKLPFPFNIAAMAATGAALVAAGVAVLGGGGGAKPAPVTNTGTGTVLGDRSAKSDSIKNAINALQEVDRLMLTSSREMAASLRSIDQQIGGLASVLVRSGNISADSQVAQGFKTNAIGSVLSKIPLIGNFLGGLFGTKTTVKGSGLFGGDQSIGSILQGGYDAQTYSDVEKVKKLFGITTSKKTSTVYGGPVDDSVSDQFALILRSFNDAIVAAAGPLGASTDEIAGKLSGFVFSLGKIDLSGLSGTEIQEKLEAVFGAAADNMAAGAFPGIERFQKVGEGAFETLVRVSSTVESVTAALDQLGAATAGLGIDAKVGLAAQFDSLGDLSNAVGSYFERFYTPAEQTAAKAAQLGTVFASLGTAMPATLAGFRQLVEAQDLTTVAGQATYATLLQLAPAFAELKASMDGAKSAADILSERQDLERQLLELRGDTAALRALDLARLDASNRGLQEQVWAVQDAQKAAEAADQLRQAWTSIGDGIADEVKRIRGLTAGSAGGGFSVLQGRFNAATAAARGGDQDAAKSLPGLSQALLTAAAAAATSRQELDRVQAATATSLEQTKALIDAIGAAAVPTQASTAATMAAAAAAAQASAAPAAANDDTAAEVRALRAELAGMRSENAAGHAATAGNTGRMARTLDTVTADSGGTAISVADAA